MSMRARFRRLGATKSVWWALAIGVVGGGIWISNWVGGTPVDEREEPGILIHLKSKLGDRAPAFTLSDSEGKAYTVTPGGGTPTILVFHMGTR